MKTKFFKKLSFVLVVAMVLSLFVPAAGVFAAAKPSLNSKNKYLHLSGNPGPNEYNFNIKNKKKGWSYEWESDNEAIAEVNVKNGVTVAKAVGKTKVTVYITDKNGEEVQTLSATVTVRDNIKEVSISNPVETLAVGEAHDYNRSYVTEANSTKKTSAITRWTVSPDTATIDEKGVFVATAGGEYTVTALSFQSKAKYNDWKADAEKYADYVLDTDETKVVVSANIVGVTQLDKTKFTVEFDSSMKDTDLSKDTAMVYQIINGKQYNTGTEKIKDLSLDATGKVATVELFGNIVGKAEYLFVYGDLKDGFTAADNNIKEVARLTFDDFQVKTDGTDPVDLFGKVNALNKDGVIILNGNDYELKSYLSFKYEGDVNYGWEYEGKAYINKNGYAGKFTVNYSNYIYNDAAEKYEPVELEAFAMGLGVDVLISNNTMQFAVVKAGTAPDPWSGDWKSNEFSVPADDEEFQIYTRFKKNTDPSWADYTVANKENNGTFVPDFHYVSTNTDRLVVIGNYLYPISQGTVTILVQDPENNNAVIGAFELLIQPSRGYASAIPSTFSVSLGNGNATLLGADHVEKQEFTVANKDTMSEGVIPTVDEIKLINKPSTVTGEPMLITGLGFSSNWWDYGTGTFSVTAPDAVAGQYNYKITLKAYNSTKSFNILVNVLDSSVPTVASWKVELDSPVVDVKEQKGTKDVTVNVYGYNSRGARVEVLPTSGFSLEVVKMGGGTIASPGNTIPVVKNTVDSAGVQVPYVYVTGTAISFVDLASYVVTAKSTSATSPTGRGVGVPINTATLKVEDNSKIEFKREKTSVSAAEFGDVKAAVKEAFSVKLNDNDINWDHAYIEYTLGGVKNTTNLSNPAVVNGNSIRVTRIFFEKSFDDGATVVTYAFNINQTLTLGR